MLSGVCQTLFRVLGDQPALEMRDRPEDVEDGPADSRGGVDPLVQADQANLPRFQVIDDLQRFRE